MEAAMPNLAIKGSIALLIAAALLALMRAAVAQPIDLDILRANKETKVHAAPDANSPVLFSVPERTHLIWAVKGERDGFYRVIREHNGPQGWAAKDDVDV